MSSQKTSSRRQFLGLMGASMALAGLVSCRRPVEKIIPYVMQPEEIIPGVPNYYATTMNFGASCMGLVVESQEGRPTKIEGNKDHPSSLGATSVWAQGEILRLYDPDRSKNVLHRGEKKTWDDFLQVWQSIKNSHAAGAGEGLAFLTEEFSSLALFEWMKLIKQTYPKALTAVYDPMGEQNVLEGIRLATGESLVPLYSFDRAGRILSLESDFLLREKESVSYARHFADGRRVTSEKDSMNRLYVVESGFCVTGSMADHRLRLPSSLMPAFVLALIREFKRQGLALKLEIPDPLRQQVQSFDFDRPWIEALCRDLMQHRGESLIVAGSRQEAAVHALVYALNEALLNHGRSVTYRPAWDLAVSDVKDLEGLAGRMAQGQISTLVILGGNPVYTAPANLQFADALKKVQNSIHLALYEDETSERCEWHLPKTHFLESWGDARAVDGTLSVVQPLIAPLYEGKSALEVLATLYGGVIEKGYDLVRKTWSRFLNPSDFEKQWRQVVHDGYLKQEAENHRAPPARFGVLSDSIRSWALPGSRPDRDRLELVFSPSASVFDGRYSNVSWLQELPDPITKITWDNAALISPRTARDLGLKNSDVVSLSAHGVAVEIPVWIVPGQADYSVGLTVGYGKTSAGRVEKGVGVNVFPLRGPEDSPVVYGAVLKKTGRVHALATTQDHGSMEGRPLVREANLDDYKKNPDFTSEAVVVPELKSAWQEHLYTEGLQWGMAIDLNVCTGCNACTIACQSENNIPVVGKDEVMKSREMSWIRMDRYFMGDPDDPEIVHQPLPCQHCELAPCEQVCPVAATVHTEEGVNIMVYNRCVGTRYCANNCPYKVRRFNFFAYNKGLPEVEKMAKNPDVTVRSRGVMEKCSFCSQRFSEAKIRAKLTGREPKDGDVVSACQQACPPKAIVFGNINDPESEVSKMKAQNRNYTILAEINTKPRVSYLSKIRNPNPEIRQTAEENKT